MRTNPNCEVRLFKEREMIGVRWLSPDDECMCDRGGAVSVALGIGLFRPQITLEWGAYTRSVWRGRAGQRVDLGWMFECCEWVNLYGVSGRRWDRVIRTAMRQLKKRFGKT